MDDATIPVRQKITIAWIPKGLNNQFLKWGD